MSHNSSLKLRIEHLDLILDVWTQANGNGLSARLTGEPGAVIRFRDTLAKTFARFAPGFTSYIVQTSVLAAIPDTVPESESPVVTDSGWIRFEITHTHAIITMQNLSIDHIDKWFKPFEVLA